MTLKILLLTLGVTSSLHSATLIGLANDARVTGTGSHNDSGTGSHNDSGTVSDTGSGTLIFGNPNVSTGPLSSPVYVFQLPNLGLISNPFTSANFSVSLITHGTVFDGYNADVYALGVRASSAVVSSDGFGGSNSDTTDATKLQENWINFNVSPSVAAGIKTLNETGQNNLLNYLNASYDTGANIGNYVFLRLSPDATGNSFKNVQFASATNATEASRPMITYEAIPEPTPAVLAALSSMALLFRRRQFKTATMPNA